jgi:penicillin-binding protein 1A
MRDDPFDGNRRPDPRWGAHSAYPDDYLSQAATAVPPPDSTGGSGSTEPGYTTNLPVVRKKRHWGRIIVRAMAACVVLFVILVGWLAITAPLSKSLQPPTPPSVTLLAADGTPIARRGATVDKPVDASKLPKYVPGAFIAIEDRRFYSHWGVDPWGIMRAMAHNVMAGGVREGGSTITQQLAKNAFLDSDRTAGRKLREALIAFWLEAWLSKNEILSRYLSNVYFGDNVYGLRAASLHYFNVEPEQLSVSQAAMLAGLVKAPSKLAPTGNLRGAQDREKVVLGAMVAAGVLTKDQADVRLASVRVRPVKELPDGTYFADWVLPEARDTQGDLSQETKVVTTLEPRLQKAAERAVRRAGLRQAQVAIVAMRPDGRVVAMVGGKDYKTSPFNRATQARRQPGSTFKLFVYLAAMRAGMTPDDMVEDEPITIGG